MRTQLDRRKHSPTSQLPRQVHPQGRKNRAKGATVYWPVQDLGVQVTTWEYADLWLAIARPTAADSRTTFAILDVDAGRPRVTEIAKPLTYFNELGREGWIVPPRGRVDVNVLQTKITEALGPTWVAIGGNHFRLCRERPERATDDVV